MSWWTSPTLHRKTKNRIVVVFSNDFYMPNDGSPYPRDFIIDQEGIIRYSNNEIDTEWMLYVLNDLINNNQILLGDLNLDNTLNILDIVSLVNEIL